MMERVNRILRHPLWKSCMQQIQQLEETREFCGHGIDHLFHVARLAYIEAMEQSLKFSKELIYAVALLHDIGRGLEYEQGIPHEEASASLARTIMAECGFSEEERLLASEAIRAHRDKDSEDAMDLAGVLYRADKASRNCFFCEAENMCNWSHEKKNMYIRN